MTIRKNGSSIPIQFKRLYKGPLDVDSIFESIQDANIYLESGTAYPGQNITIRENGEWKLYIVNDNNKLESVESSHSGETPSIPDDVLKSLSWEEL